MDKYELVLLVKPEVFVFRLPPVTTKTFKAADWNLNNPDWIGRLRLISIGDNVEIRLEDKTTGDLYAKAPIEAPNSIDFDPVSDSSRYFVIRLKSDCGKTAFVGIGFADRSDSFDLSVAIQDHFKSVKKSEECTSDTNAPKLDLGLKEGQTITVKIGKKANNNSTGVARPKACTDGAAGIFPLLPPPPTSALSTNRVRGIQSLSDKT